MERSNHDAPMGAARNQSLFRGINETIDGVNRDFRFLIDYADYVCECANDVCMERIRLSPDDYAAIRRVPTHFLVKARHVYPEFERVVDERDGYVVVEKFGEAGAEAVALAKETVQPRR